MEIPATTAAVAALVALIIPGLVYSSVRASLTGYRGTDRTLSSRFAHAVTIGVVLNAVYLGLLGRIAYDAFGFDASNERVIVANPIAAGWTVMVFGFVAPAAVAVIVHTLPWARIPIASRAVSWASQHGLVVVNRVPTAWDQAGRRQSGVFVRVTRSTGTVVGGFYDKGSFMSGYPEKRDIFIGKQWRMDDIGAFVAELDNSAGLWIAVTDDDIIEWIRPEEE